MLSQIVDDRFENLADNRQKTNEMIILWDFSPEFLENRDNRCNFARWKTTFNYVTHVLNNLNNMGVQLW